MFCPVSGFIVLAAAGVACGRYVQSPLITGEKASIFVNHEDCIKTQRIKKPPAGTLNAVLKYGGKWPNGIVPYTIEGKGYRLSLRTQTVMEAISIFHNYTCVRFVPRTNENDYIQFIDDGSGGCWSYIGKTGGAQPVNLGAFCSNVQGIILHEITHALGFIHEQSRPDRDKYVTVVWDKIRPGRASNFDKYPTNDVNLLGFSYDYGSLMHYGFNAFTSDGSATLLPKDPNADIGQRSGFSICDLEKINSYFECTEYIKNDPTCRMQAPVESKGCSLGKDYFETLKRAVNYRLGFGSNHFYTTNTIDHDIILSQNYVDLGEVGKLAKGGTDFSSCPCIQPLYRLYSAFLGDHFYTVKQSERLSAQQFGYKYEKMEGFCVPEATCGATLPLYRLFHLFRTDHFYTTSQVEFDLYVKLGYVFERVECYLWPL